MNHPKLEDSLYPQSGGWFLLETLVEALLHKRTPSIKSLHMHRRTFDARLSLHPPFLIRSPGYIVSDALQVYFFGHPKCRRHRLRNRCRRFPHLDDGARDSLKGRLGGLVLFFRQLKYLFERALLRTYPQVHVCHGRPRGVVSGYHLARDHGDLCAHWGGGPSRNRRGV